MGHCYSAVDERINNNIAAPIQCRAASSCHTAIYDTNRLLDTKDLVIATMRADMRSMVRLDDHRNVATADAPHSQFVPAGAQSSCHNEVLRIYPARMRRGTHADADLRTLLHSLSKESLVEIDLENDDNIDYRDAEAIRTACDIVLDRGAARPVLTNASDLSKAVLHTLGVLSLVQHPPVRHPKEGTGAVALCGAVRLAVAHVWSTLCRSKGSAIAPGPLHGNVFGEGATSIDVT